MLTSDQHRSKHSVSNEKHPPTAAAQESIHFFWHAPIFLWRIFELLDHAITLLPKVLMLIFRSRQSNRFPTSCRPLEQFIQHELFGNTISMCHINCFGINVCVDISNSFDLSQDSFHGIRASFAGHSYVKLSLRHFYCWSKGSARRRL